MSLPTPERVLDAIRRLQLPNIPIIKNEDISKLIRTHPSYTMTTKGGFECSGHCDYEKIEHVGDGIVSAIVTLLLHELYPNLKQGSATTIKGYLVNNVTFSALAKRYQLTLDLRAGAAQWSLLTKQERVQAALFEAYVAGVYLSSMKERPEITSGQAIDIVSDWLRDIFTPLACAAYEYEREQYRTKSEGKGKSTIAPTAAVNRLQEYLCGRKHKPRGTMEFIKAVDCSEGTHPRFQVKCVVLLVDGNKSIVTTGFGMRIQAAKNDAAWLMCNELELD